jgi:hypothetical protein
VQKFSEPRGLRHVGQVAGFDFQRLDARAFGGGGLPPRGVDGPVELAGNEM